MVKREPSIEPSETDTENNATKSVVKSPLKKAKASPSKSQPKTPSPSKDQAQGTSPSPNSILFRNQSPKGKLGEMIIECGIQNYCKSEAHIRTGLSPAQQAEMLKKGRGSLRKALLAAVSDL